MKLAFFICLALAVVSVAVAALFKGKQTRVMWVVAAVLACGTAVSAFFAFVDLHNHQVVVLSRTEATCTQSGEIVFGCKECDEGGYVGVIAKKAHRLDEFDITKKPTCADGEQTAHCKDCDYFEVQSIPAVEKHEMGEWVEVKPVTCANEGVKECRCKKCGHVRQLITPAKPCTW